MPGGGPRPRAFTLPVTLRKAKEGKVKDDERCRKGRKGRKEG